jgi:hypothetical protein
MHNALDRNPRWLRLGEAVVQGAAGRDPSVEFCVLQHSVTPGGRIAFGFFGSPEPAALPDGGDAFPGD